MTFATMTLSAGGVASCPVSSHGSMTVAVTFRNPSQSFFWETAPIPAGSNGFYNVGEVLGLNGPTTTQVTENALVATRTGTQTLSFTAPFGLQILDASRNVSSECDVPVYLVYNQ